MAIKTTHVGSLPRPQEMITRTLKKEAIAESDLHAYVSEVLKRQISLGLSYINNGEVPRSNYVESTVSRFSGFFGTGTAPLPKDLEDLPEYARRFGARNALITLNPKAPVKLPACSEALAYIGEDSLRKEVEMMVNAFRTLKENTPASEAQLFFTSPSPGTVALFMEDLFYGDYERYLGAIGDVLKQEYDIIAGYGVQLQIDCPDLAMGRHTRFKDLDEDRFLSIIDANIRTLNRALADISPDRCRVHICWGNYPGTHHRDIDLEKIFSHVMQVDARFISLESSNHRHGHEWEVFRRLSFPEDKVLLPGVIDTTSNTIEHPELVARRIRNFADILGPERVVGSTDCGFASTASATSVSGEVAWLKLRSLVEGARIAAARYE